MKEGKRLFHSFGTYKVQVELDERKQETVSIATDVETRVEPK